MRAARGIAIVVTIQLLSPLGTASFDAIASFSDGMSTSRPTRGQQAVLDVLKHRSQPLSAQDIFLALRESDRPVGLATVYRAISSLKDGGDLQEVDLGDSQSYYQLAAHDHHSHHHLICTKCRKVVPLSCCPLGDLETSLSKEYDFAINRHVLDFYGVCAECRS